MEVEREKRFRTVNAILVVAALAGLAAGLVVQIAYATRAAGQLDAPGRRYLGRLAWLALVLLAFDLVMGFWLAIRLAAARSRRRREGSRTKYVDAWAAAGRRFRLDGEPGRPGRDGPDEESE